MSKMALEDRQQILSSDRLDNLRRELDGKIDKKVSFQIFFWIIGGLVALSLACFGLIFNQTNQESNKLDGVNNRLIVIETLIAERGNKGTL
jgi:hypothetical protein